MTPLLGKPLSEYVFADAADPEAVVAAQRPAAADRDHPARGADHRRSRMTQLLAAYGITPDLVMGHSLGEYGALVAAGALTFDAALEAVSARGREMTHVSQADNGAMAAVFGPLADIERIVAEVDGLRRRRQHQLQHPGRHRRGDRPRSSAPSAAFQAAGITAMRIPVCHAFHTADRGAGASEPLKVAHAPARGPRTPSCRSWPT